MYCYRTEYCRGIVYLSVLITSFQDAQSRSTQLQLIVINCRGMLSFSAEVTIEVCRTCQFGGFECLSTSVRFNVPQVSPEVRLV